MVEVHGMQGKSIHILLINDDADDALLTTTSALRVRRRKVHRAPLNKSYPGCGGVAHLAV